MSNKNILAALTAFSLAIGALGSAAVAANIGGGPGHGGDGGGSTPSAGPSAPSAGPSSGNANFNAGSAYVKPPICEPGDRRCKPVIKILPVVVEIPQTKCQLERLVQIGNGPFGEPVFQFKRDCDRLYVQ
jgi:hypothetical protein